MILDDEERTALIWALNDVTAAWEVPEIDDADFDFKRRMTKRFIALTAIAGKLNDSALAKRCLQCGEATNASILRKPVQAQTRPAARAEEAK